jgi:hypothetical protein
MGDDDIKKELAKLKKELADQKAEVEALKAAQPKPKPEFKEQPYQRYDPTEGMTMPLSTLRDMVNAVPDRVMRDVVFRDARAPQSPGMIPSSQEVSNVRGNIAGGGTGYVDPRPLSNPPGVAQADKLMDEQDRRDRAELAQRLAALKR